MSFVVQVSAWVACLCVLPLHAVAQERSGRDLVELIVRDGPRAQAIREEAEVVRREQLARLARPNPSLQYSREGAGFTEFVQVEQPFQAFGLRSVLSRLGVEAAAAADATRDARLWELRAEAAGAVARLAAEQARLGAGEAHLKEIERLVGILRTREREGEGSRLDRLRAEQELRETRQIVVAANAAMIVARARLQALAPPGTRIGNVGRQDHIGLAGAPPPSPEERAKAGRHELRALDREIARAELESTASRTSRRPGFTVFGGLKRADDAAGRAKGAIGGVSFTVPLFDRGQLDVARWTAETSRLAAERRAVETAIVAEVAAAEESLTLRSTALADEAAAGESELLQIAEVAYREGEVGILELLDAVRTSARARVRLIEMSLDVRLAQIALERAVGGVLWP